MSREPRWRRLISNAGGLVDVVVDLARAGAPSKPKRAVSRSRRPRRCLNYNPFNAGSWLWCAEGWYDLKSWDGPRTLPVKAQGAPSMSSNTCESLKIGLTPGEGRGRAMAEPPGYFDGRHYVKWTEDARHLEWMGDVSAAERLLKKSSPRPRRRTQSKRWAWRRSLTSD